MQKRSMKTFKVNYVMERISRYILLCPLQMVLLFLFVSCGSSKNVTQSENEKEVKKDIVEQTTISENRDVHESSQSNEETEIIETITEYSEPDSTGNQYTKKKIERKVVSKKGKEGAKKVKEEIFTDNMVVDKSEEKTSEKSKKKTEVKENNQLAKIVIGCFVVVCVFVSVRFFKR